MASVAELPIAQLSESSGSVFSEATAIPDDSHAALDSSPTLSTHVTTTIYRFPSMEPLRFAYYPITHLYLPLRRDILHRAVIYEGDAARSGTANTKWRDDVHGSHKKLYQQKGTGRARVGDKQSPIRRGGGVAFGPKPRDFSTKLQKKVYDLAWRTALSYRYRRGQLTVVDRIEDTRSTGESWLRQVFEGNGWGNAAGRSLLIAKDRDKSNDALFRGVERVGEQGRLLELAEVDVKDLLEMGRVIIEQRALNAMLKRHSSDLVPTVKMVSSAPNLGTLL